MKNPVIDKKKPYRGHRGGSWGTKAGPGVSTSNALIRASSRPWFSPSFYYDVGFRIVRTKKNEKPR